MAQKAAKSLASRNAALLNRTHIVTLVLHSTFFLQRWLFNHSQSLKPYLCLACPTLVIEFYLERLGRPRYHAADGSLRTPGEDMRASGLTEYMWDILYWTWGCIAAVCVFGNMAWWLWTVVPLYSTWLAYTILAGMRRGMAGMGEDTDIGESKRQKKMEKKGGQRVHYR